MRESISITSPYIEPGKLQINDLKMFISKKSQMRVIYHLKNSLLSIVLLRSMLQAIPLKWFWLSSLNQFEEQEIVQYSK